jgi:ubiquinone/menaquinone biosynthesis C-methylase UbiE
MRGSSELQKRLAIRQHSFQADQFARRYEDFPRTPYGSCFHYSRYRLEQWLDQCLPRDGAGLRLLDVGCGTGHHLVRLRGRGFEVAGIDGSEEMLEHARAINPGTTIHHADVEALPFPDASLDVVICIEVLRYLPDPTRCLREMARVLKPGGICLATAVPILNLNGYWLVNRLANLLPTANLVRLKQFFATSAGLRRRCREAGFLPPAIHGVYFGPINWVERLAPGVLPRFLRRWERLDRALADRAAVREFANLFLIHAVRKAEGP